MTIQSISDSFPLPYRLYIADDGDISCKKESLYQQLEKDGHKVIRFPDIVGLSAGRNAILDALGDEKYVLIMDDDILYDRPDTIKMMKTVLDSKPDIGITAGVLLLENGKHYRSKVHSNGLVLSREKNVLYRDGAKNYDKVDNLFFVYSDQVVNFFLAKRDVFNGMRWDDEIKIQYEHMDFFLELKKLNKWKVTTCMRAYATHLNPIFDLEYERHRRTAPPDHFLQKHGIMCIVDGWS